MRRTPGSRRCGGGRAGRRGLLRRPRGGTHQARLERDIAGDVHPAPARRPRHRRRAARASAASTSSRGPDEAPPLVRRPHRGRGRRPHAARRRLAGAGRRAVLPGHRGRADGRRPAPAPHHDRKGRELVGLDDEVFDADAVDEAGLHGRGRGRAARRARAQPHRPHGRHRRHHPGRAGRGDPRRPRRARSSSRGGPGTGKTAVALHRAAYLLYTYRRRLGVAGRAARRAEPGVPALHRAGAAVARRAGRAALARSPG